MSETTSHISNRIFIILCMLEDEDLLILCFEIKKKKKKKKKNPSIMQPIRCHHQMPSLCAGWSSARGMGTPKLKQYGYVPW